MVLLSACGVVGGQEVVVEVPGGDAGRGEAAIQQYGCNSCHTIPGVPQANATVGPPLTDWALRRYIAGTLLNNPENLITWIRFPQSIEPGSVMPDMGVTESDARDIAAYLYTLNRTSVFKILGMKDSP